MSPGLAEWVAAYGGPGLFAAAFVGATLVPVSSEAAFVGAVLAGLAPAPALAWATAGNALGCAVNWALVRFAGGRVRPRLQASRAGRRALAWLDRWGLPALLLSWLPVVGDPLTLAAGVARVRFGVFLPVVAALRAGRYAALLLLT